MNRLAKILTWLFSFVVLFAGLTTALVGASMGAQVFVLGILLICVSIGMNVYLALDIAKPA